MRRAGGPPALLLVCALGGCSGDASPPPAGPPPGAASVGAERTAGGDAADVAPGEAADLASGGESAEPPAGGTAEGPGGFLSLENQLRVLLFFPAAELPGLVPEQRVIFKTDTLTSQVKQAVSELIGGPVTEGLLAPFPPGTELRGVFLPGTGLAVIDLGPLALSIPHGTEWEQSSLFSLVDTVVQNFPEVHRVQVLVEGQEVLTLAGHLDTSRPLGPDMELVDWRLQRLLDEDGAFLPYLTEPEEPEEELPQELLYQPVGGRRPGGGEDGGPGSPQPSAGEPPPTAERGTVRP